MSENIGAKPAASVQPKPQSQLGAVEETINQMASEVCGFVRQQPFTAAALMGGIGLLVGLLLGRR